MTWTPNRPTKPGRYEVSRHPRLRGTNELHTIERSVALIPRWLIDGGDAVEPRALAIRMDSGSEGAWIRVSDAVFDGALWRPYVEPPDPFAEPVPSLREKIEALPDLVLGSGRVIGGAVDRGAVLALLEKESQ